MSKFSYSPKRNFGTHGILYANDRRKRNSHSKFFCCMIFFVVLCIIFFMIWGIGVLIKQHGVEIKKKQIKQDQDLEIISAGEETSSAIMSQQNDEKNNVYNVNPERDFLFQKQYDDAYILFSHEDFFTARDQLRTMLEIVPWNAPIFENIVSLLNHCTSAIQKNGTDPEMFVNYKISSGDTLSKIAKKYHTTVSSIQTANNMTASQTFLKSGKGLKIPNQEWKITINRISNYLAIFVNGKYYKIFHVYSGTSIPENLQGEYKVVSKDATPVWKVNGQVYPYGAEENICGARFLALNPLSGKGASTAIHGSNTENIPDTSPGAQGYFRLSNADVKELFDLIPKGTPVQIILQ